MENDKTNSSEESQTKTQKNRSLKEKIILDFLNFLENYKLPSTDQTNEGKILKEDMEDILKSIKFFLSHFDVDTSSSHMRNESWSLDIHILEDLAFNIPLIKKFGGFPGQILIENNLDPNTDYESGKKLWDEELDNILHHIWLYLYYENFGIYTSSDTEEFKKYTSGFKLPEYPDGSLNYKKLEKLQQNEWKEIWKHIEKWGQALWT